MDNKACPNDNHAGIDTADIDSDGNVGLIFSNGWFEGPEDPAETSWAWHEITNIQGISNSLAKDIDGDGDLDLVTAAGNRGSGVFLV